MHRTEFNHFRVQSSIGTSLSSRDLSLRIAFNGKTGQAIGLDATTLILQQFDMKSVQAEFDSK